MLENEESFAIFGKLAHRCFLCFLHTEIILGKDKHRKISASIGAAERDNLP
jgi:hypothetical protein